MVKETPPKDSIEKFWKGIWGEKKACNMSTSWIGNMGKGNKKVNKQEWENITILDVNAALTKSPKWKSPEIDKVLNFWLNALSSSNVMFTSLLNEIMQNKEKLLNGCAREQHNYLLKAMTQKTLKTIDKSLHYNRNDVEVVRMIAKTNLWSIKWYLRTARKGNEVWVADGLSTKKHLIVFLMKRSEDLLE